MMHERIEYIEIPVTVVYAIQEEKKTTRHEEGNPKAALIIDIKLPDDPIGYIFKRYQNEFAVSCLEEHEG